MELENFRQNLPYVRVTLVFPWLSTTEKQDTFGDFVANLLTDSSKFLGSSSATCWSMTKIWVPPPKKDNSVNTCTNCKTWYMLWFNFALVQFGNFLCSGVWKYMIMNLKQMKIPECTKGKIEPQHMQLWWSRMAMVTKNKRTLNTPKNKKFSKNKQDNIK